MEEELAASAKLLLELIAEQREQEAAGLPLKSDNHKLSEVALLLSRALRAFPPAVSVPPFERRPAEVQVPNEEVRMDVE